MHGFFASSTSKLRYMYARAGAVSISTKISEITSGNLFSGGQRYTKCDVRRTPILGGLKMVLLISVQNDSPFGRRPADPRKRAVRFFSDEGYNAGTGINHRGNVQNDENQTLCRGAPCAARGTFWCCHCTLYVSYYTARTAVHARAEYGIVM